VPEESVPGDSHPTVGTNCHHVHTQPGPAKPPAPGRSMVWRHADQQPVRQRFIWSLSWRRVSHLSTRKLL